MANFAPSEWESQDVSGIPTDDAMAQLMLKRRLAQADLLRQQEAPQGQMVSGHYVAPSWTQYLANAVGKYQAGQQEREAMKQYGEYGASKQKRLATALDELNAKTGPQAITQEGTYNIQVPNGQQPTPTDNLGGMQPYESGMKNISVPMTTTTGYRPSTAAERDAAMYKFAVATQNPDLMSKVAFDRIAKQDQQEALKAQHEYDALIHKRDRGEKLSDTEAANLFALDKMKQEQSFTAGQNALNRANQVAIHNADVANKPLTEAQANARLYSDRMSAAHDIVTKMEPMNTKDKAGNLIKGKMGYDPLVVKSIITAPGGINDAVYAMSSPANQSASQAIRDFINATLRRESGAAISAGEYDNAIRQYFPQMGEDSKVIEQKRLARERAINGIREAGGYPRGQSQQSNMKVDGVYDPETGTIK